MPLSRDQCPNCGDRDSVNCDLYSMQISHCNKCMTTWTWGGPGEIWGSGKKRKKGKK